MMPERVGAIILEHPALSEATMPFNIGPGELILVLVIALVVIGPGKLPGVGQALGKSIREFREAVSGDPKAVIPTTSNAVPAAAEPATGADRDSTAG
jgi:sec-independent protein translocase protein TatA